MNNRLLTARRAAKGVRPVVAGDIETVGLGGAFVLGALLPDGGQVAFYDTEEGMLDAFLQKRFCAWELLLHNADYDIRYFLPSLILRAKYGFTTQLTVDGQGRIIYATIERGRDKWYIRDTYALLPYSLAALAPLAGIQKGDIGLSAGTVFNPASLAHRLYLSRDVTCLLLAYKAFVRGLQTTFHISPGLTAGATALKAFQASLPQDTAYWRQRPEVETMARRAYFGGLTFATTYHPQPDCVKIDVHAMYAHAMRQGVPVGSGTYTTHEQVDRPGVWACEVECDRDHPFPFIPSRSANRALRPTGRFTTCLYSHTIRLARQCGYKVVVCEGYYFDRLADIFGGFIQKCEELEHTYQKQGIGQIVKMLRNALYGKFGQRGTYKQYWLTDNPTEDMTPHIDQRGGIVDYVYWTEDAGERAHTMPLWAGWIAATARNYLVATVFTLGAANCYYGDTDSVVCPTAALQRGIASGAIRIGSNYGDWGIKGFYTLYRPLGLKAYIGQANDGALDIRHKGIPLGTLAPADLMTLPPGVPLAATYTRVNRALRTTHGTPFSEPATKHLTVGAI